MLSKQVKARIASNKGRRIRHSDANLRRFEKLTSLEGDVYDSIAEEAAERALADLFSTGSMDLSPESMDRYLEHSRQGD